MVPSIRAASSRSDLYNSDILPDCNESDCAFAIPVIHLYLCVSHSL